MSSSHTSKMSMEIKMTSMETSSSNQAVKGSTDMRIKIKTMRMRSYTMRKEMKSQKKKSRPISELSRSNSSTKSTDKKREMTMAAKVTKEISLMTTTDETFLINMRNVVNLSFYLSFLNKFKV